MTDKNKIIIDRGLFDQTSHSPALTDVLGGQLVNTVIDFCFIANPYYPDKELLRQMQKQLPKVIKSYPSSNPIIARQHLASVLKVNPHHLVIGNGATELITIIMNQMVENLAVPVPTFSEYIDKAPSLNHVSLYHLSENNQYTLNLEDYSKWILENNIPSALIINPGNPTGELLPLIPMQNFLEANKQLKMILVDESFIDFAGTEIPSLLHWVEKYPNLLIVRSMSKHCGMPGLRLGYCCTANELFIAKLVKALPVWNINTLAEYFLSQLLATDTLYHQARLKVIDDIQFLYLQLKDIEGFKVYSTGSNFVLIKSECGLTAQQLQTILLQEYYCYVRDCSNKVGIDQYHIRVASQGKSKDLKLVRALRKIAKKQLNNSEF